MAIYSLNMRSIGRQTHAEGTAGAHIRYIARDDAEPHLMAAHMPEDPNEARSFLDRGERADRKNARVIDKIRIALPIEMDDVQRADLVQSFADKLTEGRVPWYAAIHQTGDDAHNPHAHLVIRDRDIETGKRHVRLSDSARDWQKAGRPEDHPVQHVRTLWERECNAKLESCGIDARIDRRSLEAQGIDRTPQIHMGPQGQYVETYKHRPESREVPERSWRRTQYRDKTPYPDIDLGRTRKERNAEIIDLNIERAARSPKFETRKWAEFERTQIQKDRILERQFVEQARRQEREREKVRLHYRQSRDDVYARKEQELKSTQEATQSVWNAKRSDLAQKHQTGSEALQAAQNRFSARFLRLVDITGRTQRAQDQEKADLAQTQAIERRMLEGEARRAEQIQAEAVQTRYAAELVEIRVARQSALRGLEDRHLDVMQRHQLQLQYREAERHAARESLTRQLADWKRQNKSQSAQTKSAAQAFDGYASDPSQRANDSDRADSSPKHEDEDLHRLSDRLQDYLDRKNQGIDEGGLGKDQGPELDV